MTQKQLGEILGFLGKTSDVRMAQYESEARTPKQDLVKEMANIFDVSPRAITVPEIDSYIGLMHTLFALEDMYGLKIGEIDGEVCLRLDKSDCSTYSSMFKMFHAWQEQSAKLERGEISREEYDQWRYKYPELDTSGHWGSVPSQAVSDMLAKEFQEIEKEEKKASKRKAEISIKRPCRCSVSISENQQGFSLIEVFCYSVSDTQNVAKSLPRLKQICLQSA